MASLYITESDVLHKSGKSPARFPCIKDVGDSNCIIEKLKRGFNWWPKVIYIDRFPQK